MEISREYALAYVEVLEILKKLSVEYYKMIPKEKISFYEEFKDRDYIFYYDNSKSMGSQVRKETKAVLSNLFLNYIASEEDRQKIHEKDRIYLLELEEQKKTIKLNPLFVKPKKVMSDDNSLQKQLIKIEKRSIFKQIVDKIMNFFKL